MSKKENWVWMPQCGHFIGGSSCRFHLNTYVGGYIISTVGEYAPHGESFGNFVALGIDRLYETMVFEANREQEADAQCCPWTIDVSKEVDMEGYNDPALAYKGHLKLCRKWATTNTKSNIRGVK